MSKNKFSLFFQLIFLYFCFSSSFAQTNIRCATDEKVNEKLAKDPELGKVLFKQELDIKKWISENALQRTTSGVITIPVVVHVVMLASASTISDAQISSQIAVLNADYGRKNSDTVNTPSAFVPLAADCEIKFQLAMYDPNHNPTNGITRTTTTKSNIGSDTSIYYTASGGQDIWDPCRYYNIWVCRIGGGILGLTYSPVSGNAHDIGSVIDYQAFGVGGTSQSPYDLGRTLTHESGHFLSLYHPFGTTGGCYDADSVTDTPKEATNVFGCPAFPHTDACTPSSPGTMFDNYMDYADDNCMNIFTLGQKTRMQAALNTSPWACLKTSDAIGIHENHIESNLIVFPNPSHDKITVSFPGEKKDASFSLFNMLGEELFSKDQFVLNSKFEVDVSDLPNGVYVIKISSGKEIITRKVILQ